MRASAWSVADGDGLIKSTFEVDGRDLHSPILLVHASTNDMTSASTSSAFRSCCMHRGVKEWNNNNNNNNGNNNISIVLGIRHIWCGYPRRTGK